ncbi:MAG: DUF5930 domain-containing protein [Paracoccaceae bacterium]|nr:DUF5930 domain-containing protein [Paracoccaceae bacterium]MDE2915236.1 DUF5930 domain-containing protein [Paracoccaceae bacterium]
MSSRLDQYLARLLPERSVRLQSGDSVFYFRLSSPVQFLAIGLGAALFVYSFFVTFLYGLELARSASSRSQIEQLHATYEDRIVRLRSNYENRIADLDERLIQASLSEENARQRNWTTLNRLAVEQEWRLQSVGREQELEATVAALERRLHGITRERHQLRGEAEVLQTKVTDLSSNADDWKIKGENSELMLDSVAQKLGNAVDGIEVTNQEIARLRSEVDALKHELELQASRNAFVFRSVEGAVEVSLRPMIRALSQTGIDLDGLLNSVRQRYSNAGGPLESLSNAEHMLAGSPDHDRFKSLIDVLDDARVMGLAVQKTPISEPVRARHRYSSNYGFRKDPFTGKVTFHDGVDMVARSGTPILATADGVVNFAGWQGGFGRVVKIRHIGGFETVYGHLRRIHVTKGQSVSRGDRIGDMGNSGRSTGTHLHYEVRLRGDAVDPMTFLRAGRDVF